MRLPSAKAAACNVRDSGKVLAPEFTDAHLIRAVAAAFGLQIEGLCNSQGPHKGPKSRELPVWSRELRLGLREMVGAGA